VLVRLGEEDHAAFVRLAGATVEERSIRVEQDREQVAAAPRLDVDKRLTIAEVRQLYDNYGLAYSQQESPTVLPEGGFQAHEPDDDARGGPLALLTKKRALPIVLAGGIAALIGLLALRRRR
jgi:hypothetical protein